MNATDTYPSDVDRTRLALPVWVFLALLPGAAAALAGGYWDDAWHTERGRDSFFIAPHVAIYGGITLVGAALAVWAMAAVRHRGIGAARTEPGLLLALICVAVTLASGPIDNAWHLAFGRDAVIWSPPHMLGIVGMMGLALALLVQLSADPSPRAGLMRAVAAGLVLAAANVAVIEYETDVPQFGDVWFLPALTLSTAIAVSLIRRADSHPWAFTRAAVVQLGFLLAVSAFLATQNFDAPLLPVLVVPAVALELTIRERGQASLAGLAFVIALFAVYAPTRGISIHDVVVGFAPALAAALIVLVGWRPRPATTTALAVAVILLVTLAGPALAHDPGQGKDAGTVAWHVTTQDTAVHAAVTVPSRGDCSTVVPGDLVARRGGKVVRASINRAGCHLRGDLRVTDSGRWFVYADLHRGGARIESWIPVKVDGHAVVDAPHRFAYVPRRRPASWGKYAAGVVLYSAMLALLVGMARLARRTEPV